MSTTFPTAPGAGPPATARDAARAYARRNWLPIPLRARSKQPITNGWERLTRAAFVLDELFPEGRSLNVGLSLGAPSDDLVDIDLDCNEARRAAAVLMP